MYVKARIEVYSEKGRLEAVALVDTGATGILGDAALLEELRLKGFGRAEIAALGAAVQCQFADVKNVVVEGVEIGPRRVTVCRFPEEIKARLRSLGCSEKVLLGVSAIEESPSRREILRRWRGSWKATG